MSLILFKLNYTSAGFSNSSECQSHHTTDPQPQRVNSCQVTGLTSAQDGSTCFYTTDHKPCSAVSKEPGTVHLLRKTWSKPSDGGTRFCSSYFIWSKLIILREGTRTEPEQLSQLYTVSMCSVCINKDTWSCCCSHCETHRQLGGKNKMILITFHFCIIKRPEDPANEDPDK